MDIFKYFGIDWLILVLVLFHIWLLGNKNKNGFLVGMVACVCSMTFSIMAGTFANLLLGFCLFFMHLRGYCRWKSSETLCPKEKCFHWVESGGAADMSGSIHKTLEDSFKNGKWVTFPNGGCSCASRCNRLHSDGVEDFYESC